MCNCVFEIEKELKKQYNDSLVMVTDANFGLTDRKGSIQFIIPLPITYFPTKKDGSPGKMRVGCHHLIHAAFCPFCGKKL